MFSILGSFVGMVYVNYFLNFSLFYEFESTYLRDIHSGEG